jgi:dephospho-CoA kinase
MRIIFISGDGHGAGKTYLAKKIASGTHQIFSIANMIRKELEKEYPKYDWYNKSPSFKEKTIVKETGKTVHEMLDKRGNEKKSKNKLYWAQQISDILIYNKDTLKLDIAVIDDVRFVDEYEYIKKQFQQEYITHVHIINPHAKPEPLYENEKLRDLADYHIISKKVLASQKK